MPFGESEASPRRLHFLAVGEAVSKKRKRKKKMLLGIKKKRCERRGTAQQTVGRGQRLGLRQGCRALPCFGWAVAALEIRLQAEEALNQHP